MMTRQFVAGSLALAAIGALPFAARASSDVLTLSVDGHPAARSSAAVIRRDGTPLASIAELDRIFGGLLTYENGSAEITVDGTTAAFTPGSKVADVDGRRVAMSAPAERVGRQIYVPLGFVVRRVAHDEVRIDERSKTAEIVAPY
jgi:hypothetical protein